MIGNRSEQEWVYKTLPYAEFMKKLTEFYEQEYRKHNWVYKHQDYHRHRNLALLQSREAILEVDYANKYSSHVQHDSEACTAVNTSSHFVVFCHSNPVYGDEKNPIKLGHTTEVFSFWSNCVTQDTFAIRRCIQHVIETLRKRGRLDKIHIWSDGCASQNKGRKAFRQMSEMSHEQSIFILLNFACSHHFPGQWDAEGGRQAACCTAVEISGKDTCRNADDNVRVIKQKMKLISTTGLPIPDNKSKNNVIPEETNNETEATVEGVDETNVQDFNYTLSARHILRIEPCECQGSCQCRSDLLTYRRDATYDSSAIDGTMSHYQYAFFKKEHEAMVKRYSCYCSYCARGLYSRCENLDVVRSDHVRYRPFEQGHREWYTNGWRTCKLKPTKVVSPAATRQYDLSAVARKTYVSKLQIDDVVAVLDESGTGYWLAECMSKSVETDRVVFTTTRRYAEYGIDAGHDVLNITWFERVGESEPPVFKLVNGSWMIYANNVFPLQQKVHFTRMTANRYYLGAQTHELLKTFVAQTSQIDHEQDARAVRAQQRRRAVETVEPAVQAAAAVARAEQYKRESGDYARTYNTRRRR